MIYLVHFERPYKHARHYLGYTGLPLRERFRRHISNAKQRRGSALMRAVINAGIAFKVVRVWNNGDRHGERRKKHDSHARRCPVCLGRVSWDNAVDLLHGREG